MPVFAASVPELREGPLSAADTAAAAAAAAAAAVAAATDGAEVPLPYAQRTPW